MKVDKERIRRMGAAGYTAREIGEAVGCSHAYAARILAQDGPLPVPPVSIHASEGQIVIHTDSPQIVGVAIKRALERAGIEVK